LACTKEAGQFNDNLDDQGRVERAWHNVKADGHAATVLSELRS
jgi:hypothetical protein